MQNKKLFTGGINSDDSATLLKSNEYVGSMNMRFMSSDEGKGGIMQNIDGNSKRAFNPDGSIFALPSGTNKTIGAYEDKTKKRIYFFNYNSLGSHGIYCYDQPLDCVYTILLSSNVSGGLGFFNDIHSVAMIGDVLYWTDNSNEPRKINVEYGIKSYYSSYAATSTSYTFPIYMQSLTVVRPQPSIPLTVAKYADGSYSLNFTSKESFQFCYRFVYSNYETSVFSPLSKTIGYNTNGSATNYNSVDVTIPTEQYIHQDVSKIEVAVKYLTGGKFFIIKIYDRSITADATSITNHNAGTAITFRFYNDIVGYAIDNATSAKVYDYVPLKAATLEVAKNRLFFGNITEGLVAPTSTSLTATKITGSAPSPTCQWFKVTYYDDLPVAGNYDIYLLQILNAGASSGYYYKTSGVDTANPGAITVAFSSYTYIGSTMSLVLAWIKTQYGVNCYIVNQLATGTIPTVTGIPATSIDGTNIFKSGASYRVGVVFYDFAGRSCNVVTNSGLYITVPNRSYSTTSYATSIDWTLSGGSSEIPTWAYYYSIVATKSMKSTWYIQARTEDICYAVKDPSTGVISASYTAYSSSKYGVLISLRNAVANGLGYQYAEGDRVILWDSGSNEYNLTVLGTFGEYIITTLANIGTASSYGSITGLAEVYVPVLGSMDDLYYEVGSTYKINNPGLGTRAYSVAYGSLPGDSYVINRSISGVNYLVEAMSANDQYYQNWYGNYGRVQLTTLTSQVNLKTTVRYSNKYTLGSQNNGASSFDYLDFTDLPYELDTIQRLMLVNKIESEGTVMLAIGGNETASLYLGESQVFDNSGESFLAKSTNVIGNVNVLRGSYGTNNPESVSDYLGQVFWFDANKGAVVRYDVNGLIPISDYKMGVYWNKVAVDVRAGNKIFSGFDPYYEEFLISAPRVSNSPTSTKLEDVEIGSTSTASYAGSGAVTLSVTKGKLYKLSITAGHTLTYGGQVVAGGSSNNTVMVDATTGFTVTAGGSGSVSYTEIMVNNYETYDSLGGVWCFKPDISRWTSKYTYRPEWMGRVANTLVSFKDGFCYTHNHYSSNTFYSQTYDSYLSFAHSDAGSGIKVYNAITVEGDTPYMVHVRTTNPYEQSTNLMQSEFRIIEGVNYGVLLRDRLSPMVSGTYDLKMLLGDRIRGEYAKFTILHRNPTSDKEIKFATVTFNPSRGQKV